MTLYYAPQIARNIRRRMMEQMFDNDWPFAEAKGVIPVDVKAEDEAYVISAVLPGVTAENVTIQVNNQTVSIQGELKDEREEGATYLLEERPSGRFCRTLNLPEALDAAKTTAEMKDGILTLRVPKAEEVRPKTIKVTAK